MRKAALHNLGCKVNSYETEAMQQMLEAAGYEIVPFQPGADVYIINTCSVTNIADRKSRQMLHKAKKMNPQSVVVAVGCYVQAAGAELEKDAAIDLIIGNNKKKDLIEILDTYFEAQGALGKADVETGAPDGGASGQDDVVLEGSVRNSPEARTYLIDIGKTREYEGLKIERIADHTRAVIKIQDGCNQFCSYCIIPYTRGRVRSRRPEEIVEEVETLVARGYREIILTGIHLSSYGLDFRKAKAQNAKGQDGAEDNLCMEGKTGDGTDNLVNSAEEDWEAAVKRVDEAIGAAAAENTAGAGRGHAAVSDSGRASGDVDTLLDLIVRLDQIPGLERMRLGSLEPRIITEEFVRTLAGLKTICPHFHLSLQSGCDATLKRMNRHYTAAQFEEGCQILRRYFHRPAITTDVIVGFPQETEEEFAQTVEFLKRIQFYEMHVFKYSKRAGTRAAAMSGQLTEAQKAVRSDVLLELDAKLSLEYRKGFLGDEKEVLMEEKITVDGVDYLVGHTREYVKAAIPWEEGLKGRMVTGRLESMLNEEILCLSQKRYK